MRREELGDLTAFLTVAEERSFTRAAARLGTSQSALSYTVRRLEARLGMRLLTRTTRSVAATEAGERLLGALGPAIGDIEAVLAALSEFRDKPAGSFRITAGQHAIDTILWPVLSKLLKDYPDIKVELNAESALTDIVAERFDAGVRLGEQVEKDMVAVRIGPDARMIVVAAPSCFESPCKARDAPGSDQLPLHQSPPADLWRLLRLGVRQRRRGDQGSGRRTARLQRRPPDPGGGAGRLWPGLPAGGRLHEAHR